MKIQTELLKILRKEAKRNQDEVAKLIGVGRSQYANIETGNTNPSIPVLVELLKAFNITFEELYGLKQSERLINAKKKRIEFLRNEANSIEQDINSPLL